MDKKLAESSFVLAGRKGVSFAKFVRAIVTWSFENMTRSISDAKNCGIVSVLKSRDLSSTPIGTCLISYHAATYIFMLIEYSGFPIDYLEAIKKAIISDILKILNDRNNPIFSSQEEKIMDLLIPRYVKRIAESSNQRPDAITFGPGGEVIGDIEKLYDLDGATLGYEAMTKFPLLLNVCIPALHESLITEGKCKWEPSEGAGFTREVLEVIAKFSLSHEEFERFYNAYNFSLGSNGKKSNWNEDIDDLAKSIKALTDSEIEFAKTDFNRAILNRIILRFSIERSHT